MGLTSEELAYLGKRSKLIRYWVWAASSLLVILIGLVFWLWIEVPYFVNPGLVADDLKSGLLEESTLFIMAALLPVIVLALLVLTLALIIFSFISFSNEKILIQIIQREMMISEQKRTYY